MCAFVREFLSPQLLTLIKFETLGYFMESSILSLVVLAASLALFGGAVLYVSKTFTQTDPLNEQMNESL
jgi:hypothetical protein